MFLHMLAANSTIITCDDNAKIYYPFLLTERNYKSRRITHQRK